jgi:hypothetical protein
MNVVVGEFVGGSMFVGALVTTGMTLGIEVRGKTVGDIVTKVVGFGVAGAMVFGIEEGDEVGDIVMGASVVGDKVVGDAVKGDSVTGPCVGLFVTGDSVRDIVGERVTGASVVDDWVVG